jgi:hypothetical protein
MSKEEYGMQKVEQEEMKMYTREMKINKVEMLYARMIIGDMKNLKQVK